MIQTSLVVFVAVGVAVCVIVVSVCCGHLVLAEPRDIGCRSRGGPYARGVRSHQPVESDPQMYACNRKVAYSDPTDHQFIGALSTVRSWISTECDLRM